HLAGLIGRGDLAAELLSHLDCPFDLLNRFPAILPGVPEVVLVAHADVGAKDQRQVLDCDVAAHAAPERYCAGTVRCTTQHFHPMEGIAAHRAAAVAAKSDVQRSHVDAATNQALDDLELMDVTGHEVRLNLVSA